jgi:hypothetical protein
MSESTETIQQPEVPSDAEQPQLQIGDIEAAVKVIDYASEQGAFKGWTVVQEVLVLRNRLVSFVRAVTPPAAEETTDVVADAGADVPESPAA